MRRPVLAATLTAAIALGSAPAMAERTLALVIGIDDYAHIPRLDGAVNDARDIADALRALGAETTLLVDGAATRAAILDAWTRLAGMARPGDRLIVTYAGHGSNEAEATPGEEADGRDENWLLAGFSPRGADSGERIRDNEIAALIALSPQVQVMLVSDSCHSGTVARQIAPVLGYRYFRTDGTLADDPLPPPPPRPEGGDDFDAVSLYMGAVPDSEQVPEFLIDGQPRGALSWALAEGLRGAADADGDGIITAEELESQVRARVREVSRGLQRPQIATSAGGLDFVLTATTTTAAGIPGTDTTGPDTPGPEAPDPVPPDPVPPESAPSDPGPAQPAADVAAPISLAQGFADLPPVTLSLSPDAAIGAPEGAQLTAADAPADLVLDPITGRIRTMVGDLLTTVPTAVDPGFAAALQRAVDSARLAAALMALGRDGAMTLRFAEGDGTYADGDRVTVRVLGRETAHLALFNLSPDGSITPLYPLHDPARGLADPVRIDPAETLDLALQVGAPFGSDFLIAVQTANPSDAIALLLADPAGTWTASALWEALQMAEAEGTAPSVAVFPFHSQAP